MSTLRWHGWDILQLAAAFCGLIAASLFVIRYFIFAGKEVWCNPFGRFLIQREATLSVLFLYIILGRVVVGDYVTPERWPGQDFILFLLLAWFGYQTWTPYRLLLESHRQHTNERKDHDGLSEPDVGGRTGSHHERLEDRPGG